MEDDFSFTSIWGTPSDPSPILSTLKETIVPPAIDFAPSSSSSQGDDFDDFGTARTGTSDAQDDDFGDFGDFGDAEEMGTPADFGKVGFGLEEQFAGPETTDSNWDPLRLNPMPSKEDLETQLDEMLGPIWTDDISEFTTAEHIRQVEGVSQILVTPERYLLIHVHSNLKAQFYLRSSRDLYNTLFHSPPPMKPPNWTRSRIRQQHLISLGMPVNLDEVLPHANGKPLPPLQITTRPMSAPPSARNNSQQNKPSPSTNNSRSGTPIPSSRSGPSNVSQLGLGPKPELDNIKVNDLLGLDPGMFNISSRIYAVFLTSLPETLLLLPLSTLERHLGDLRTQTVNASTLLTHLLQTREALQQDSETYNGLIAELVSEAQKVKTGKGKQPTKRGSGMM